MANKYIEMKKKHQKEVNEFPMFFAFSNESFKEGMKKLGLTENDTDKVYSIGGGGFIRKTDSDSLHEIFNRHNKELTEAMEDEQFAYQMFNYELANHEYSYTGDIEDTLNALGLTEEDIENNEILKNALIKAIEAQKECF